MEASFFGQPELRLFNGAFLLLFCMIACLYKQNPIIVVHIACNFFRRKLCESMQGQSEIT